MVISDPYLKHSLWRTLFSTLASQRHKFSLSPSELFWVVGCFCKNTDPQHSSPSHSYSFFRSQFSYHCLQKIFLVPEICARCPARLRTPTPCPPSQILPHFIVIVFYLSAFLNLLWTPGGQGLYLSYSFKIVSIDPKVNNSKNVMKVILNFIDRVYGSSISSNLN